MKANKNFFLLLALSMLLINKTSYASNEGVSNVIINSIEEDDRLILSSDDSLDEDIIEKENLENYIEEIKNSTDYIQSSKEIKILYDNAIAFNSRALDKDKIDWLEFSYNNLKEDIEIIKKLADEDYLDTENINQNSYFFNDPLYKVAYLKLDKEKQDLVDDLKKDEDDHESLSISALSESNEMNVLVLYSDWMYPFMDDEESKGIITESKILIEALNEDRTLTEAFKNTKFEERKELIREIIDNHEDYAKETDLNNSLENLDDTSTTDEKQNDDGIIADDFNDSVADEDSDTSQNPDNEELDQNQDYNKISKYKYQSMFYIKNRTRKFYENLSDEQRNELDSMNTDVDSVLTIEELENSPNYKLPIINGIDWLYPFMYDKNEDGVIDENDRNSINQDIEINKNELPLVEIASQGLDTTDNNQTKSYNSVFYKNKKTKAAYENLPDDKKQILDQINTD